MSLFNDKNLKNLLYNIKFGETLRRDTLRVKLRDKLREINCERFKFFFEYESSKKVVTSKLSSLRMILWVC